MTGDGQDGRRTRGGRRARTATMAAAAMAVALTGGACADSTAAPDVTAGDVGEFAATPDYLAGVADATEGLSYRVSMDMSMGFSAQGQSLETGGTLLTGEVDGDMSSMTMDVGAVFDGFPAGAVPEELLAGDLTMEMVTDGTTGYMRAPYFAAMVESGPLRDASPSDLGPLAYLASELDDHWGRIDLSAVSPSEAFGAAGAGGSDPRAFLRIAAAGTDVRDLGSDTIDGVDARGLGALVTYGGMLEAQGMDAEEFFDRMASGMGATGGDEEARTVDRVIAAMLEAEIPIEVWVDGDDHVRRISFALDMSEIMADVAADTGEEVGDLSMSTDMVMDFSDYGDESIEIEVPTDAVDITDEYLAFIESGGAGTGATPLPG